MLQNFASYLLGSFTNYNQGAAAEGVENNNIRLTSVEKEDEWILVDRDSEGNSESSSVESLDFHEDRDGYENVDEIGYNLPLPALLTRTSSTSSLPRTSNMEESWFITPPPCFTSAGPVNMETSPLENLLIEHPSMSVYANHRRYITVPIRPSSPPKDVPENIIATDDEGEKEEEEVVVVVHRSPRISRIQVIQQQERQGLKSKQAQKMQIKKACQVMNRGHMDRNNKAREVNSRNRRQRRGERSQGATRSYANNNRKC